MPPGNKENTGSVESGAAIKNNATLEGTNYYKRDNVKYRVNNKVGTHTFSKKSKNKVCYKYN